MRDDTDDKIDRRFLDRLSEEEIKGIRDRATMHLDDSQSLAELNRQLRRTHELMCKLKDKAARKRRTEDDPDDTA